VLQALHAGQAPGEEVEVLWLGGEGGMEAELVARAAIPFTTVPAAGLHGVGLRALPGNLLKLLQGYFGARRIILEFKPDALFFTGGFVAVPAGLAGRKLPTLVYVPDIEPGLALKLVSRFADRIAVTTKTAVQYFEKQVNKLTVTGYPTRAELTQSDKDQALSAFKLSSDLPTLLVFGGSKGARSINRAVMASLETLLAEMQIIHISGTLTWPEVEKAADTLPKELADRYRAYPYLHEEMGATMAAADLVVSRAGASTLGEFPLFGLPAVLVPYPYAWRYQRINAEYLVENDAALMLRDENLTTELQSLVLELIQDQVRLRQMSAAMRDLAVPDAAHNIASVLKEMVAV
ncbi:MAG: UDP-N-acetylglucosamine--N-acetylmuramyl-(pentapeptide) pyrophosphoryl-undecaprenol N-acetylglucosamine transferase, partial [Chloroflexi bacterium]|nr:UDP-N-acetylglucosamine--N-acetylmuramyl-(pentapeptide) pyrophosphoryl-undecaprenol N-acetylglucosamine transferase [Chloroflexota bacterium]